MDAQIEIDSPRRQGIVRNPRGRPAGIVETAPRERHGKNLTKRVFAERLAKLESVGVLAGTARRVLEALGGDSYWLRIFTELEAREEWQTIARLTPLLLQMRDGRPAQQITVTSIGVRFSADEIARARAVVRELVPATPHTLTPDLVSGSVSDESFASPSPRMDGETPLMLGDGQGSRKGGV